MNVGLEEGIRNSMDGSLRTYLLSEDYQRQTAEIEQLTDELKAILSPDQKKKLMILMDAISDCDARFASEAYVKGVVEGIAFRDKFL